MKLLCLVRPQAAAGKAETTSGPVIILRHAAESFASRHMQPDEGKVWVCQRFLERALVRDMGPGIP
jgi:hypothetical protein